MKERLTSSNNKFDFIIFILVIALVIYGVAMVFSASYYDAINDPDTGPYYYLIKQGMWALGGFVLMMFCTKINYHFWQKIAIPVVIGTIILLALLFTPLGEEQNGATRWLNVGVTTIMPGEIAKIGAIIGTSAFLASDPQKILSFTKGILPLLALAGIYFILISMQPNLSTALVIVGIIIGISVLAGLQIRYIVGAIGVVAMGLGSLVVLAPHSYHTKRLLSFLDPFEDSLGDGFQVVQSLLALGSGGVFGVGIGKSIQKNLYLPEPQNDFILAIIGEETGFVGLIILLAVYGYLIYRGFKVAINAKDNFGMFMAGGITGMLAIQVIINVAVVTSSMPCTGITLPFISYGGNAMLLFMGSMGILLNISKSQKKV